ncbi:flagellar FliL protein [Actimicrobium sp. GrIS 1.19]|uniref:flagellar basal body-associated protein FliL n=1 Tax=Actimicrobium sp. GrIS 1.19 TaxID=3071708 RepID=UPI002DFFC255|nr:flagellar FliL protein [Actimicrobium sp. GrIS 1.19]
MATAPKAVPKAAPKGEEAMADAPIAKKKSKLKLVIILLVVLLIGGGAAAYFMMGAKPKTEAAKHEIAKPPVFVVMEPFTVNLQQETGEQFLQIAMTVQVADEKEVEEIKLYLPQVRSRILLLLSSKKASEINTAEGKKALAGEIAAQVKQPFAANGKPQEVKDVFFTSFVIQ